MNVIIFRNAYTPYYFLLALVYLSGLFIPLMENDAAQHAVMAMRMYLENDFVNLIKEGTPYLDKPHMHFWLAALSFKIFGISQWAYRIPALLFTLLGSYSCCRLAKTLYGHKAGHIASLVFISSQAIILANHDVRTDAVLTGALIFGIWQGVMYVNSRKRIHIICSALGIAAAFATKGQLAVFIAGLCLLSYIAYNRQWNVVLSPDMIIGVGVFLIGIFPVLYAYYVQFDLHPELIVNGRKGVSGIRFILWDQSFNRFIAKDVEDNSHDYFFFFHTLLWVFLPWSVMAYMALFSRLRFFILSKFRFQPRTEALTSVGILTILLFISFSESKLPHYLNSLLPVLAVLVAGYMVHLSDVQQNKTLRILLYMQYGILGLGSLFVLFLVFWAFSIPHPLLIGCYAILVAGLFYGIVRPLSPLKRLVVVSVSFMILINCCLNTGFYPKLLTYQAGNNAAVRIHTKQIPKEDIFVLRGGWRWALDFYTRRITPTVDTASVQDVLKDRQWLFCYAHQLKALQQRNVQWYTQYEMDHYVISRLNMAFLNPDTRHNHLEKAYLIQLKK